MLCGSVGYTGAAALAAMGALRSGAGLVFLGVPESVYPILAMKLTEPVVFPLPAADCARCGCCMPDNFLQAYKQPVLPQSAIRSYCLY